MFNEQSFFNCFSLRFNHIKSAHFLLHMLMTEWDFCQTKIFICPSIELTDNLTDCLIFKSFEPKNKHFRFVRQGYSFNSNKRHQRVLLFSQSCKNIFHRRIKIVYRCTCFYQHFDLLFFYKIALVFLY